MKTCDLHTHSIYSDGTFTPTGIVQLAKKQGLFAVALTDHNTAGGIPEFVRAGRENGIITVPGCEFSTQFENVELHVVGLFFPEKTWPEIEDFVEHMHEAKRHANRKLIAALQKAGYDVTYDEAAALTAEGEFNRSQIARVLLAKRFVSSMDQAFQTLFVHSGCPRSIRSSSAVSRSETSSLSAVWSCRSSCFCRIARRRQSAFRHT